MTDKSPAQDFHDRTKSKFQRKLKSEFSMGIYDFERMADLFNTLNIYAIASRNFEEEHMINYYSILKQIYLEFRSIMTNLDKKTYDDIFSGLKQEIISLKIVQKQGLPHEFPLQLLEKLETLEENIREVRQSLGLGFPTARILKPREKMKKVLGGKT